MSNLPPTTSKTITINQVKSPIQHLIVVTEGSPGTSLASHRGLSMPPYGHKDAWERTRTRVENYALPKLKPLHHHPCGSNWHILLKSRISRYDVFQSVFCLQSRSVFYKARFDNRYNLEKWMSINPNFSDKSSRLSRLQIIKFTLLDFQRKTGLEMMTLEPRMVITYGLSEPTRA